MARSKYYNNETQKWEYMDDGGSSIPYIAQPEAPTDTDVLWVDTDDNSGSGGAGGGSYREKELLDAQLEFEINNKKKIEQDFPLNDSILNYDMIMIYYGRKTPNTDYNLPDRYLLLTSGITIAKTPEYIWDGSIFCIESTGVSGKVGKDCWAMLRFSSERSIGVFNVTADYNVSDETFVIYSIKGIKF